jgi:hypothetical protein
LGLREKGDGHSKGRKDDFKLNKHSRECVRSGMKRL